MARIMIVDDAAFMRALLRQIVTAGGHEVIYEAENGWDGINNYMLYRPDLVTMDVTMPGILGTAAVREIKKRDANARIIMCSAFSDRHLVVDAIRAGAVDFIVKPFHEMRVLESINTVMHNWAHQPA